VIANSALVISPSNSSHYSNASALVLRDYGLLRLASVRVILGFQKISRFSWFHCALSSSFSCLKVARGGIALIPTVQSTSPYVHRGMLCSNRVPGSSFPAQVRCLIALSVATYDGVDFVSLMPAGLSDTVITNSPTQYSASRKYSSTVSYRFDLAREVIPTGGTVTRTCGSTSISSSEIMSCLSKS
jgi:hypothetical protein